jgi:hypothetical protein
MCVLLSPSTSEYETGLDFQFHNMHPHRLLAPIRSKRATCAPGDDDRAPLEARTYSTVHASVAHEVDTSDSRGFAEGVFPLRCHLRHRRIESCHRRGTRANAALLIAVVFSKLTQIDGASRQRSRPVGDRSAHVPEECERARAREWNDGGHTNASLTRLRWVFMYSCEPRAVQ